MRREFDINVGFVPVPEDAQQQEEEQFFIIDNQGEAAPPSLQCPKSIEEMMRIVQEMSCQRAEHMNSFTYNARDPNTAEQEEDDEEEVVISTRKRKRNYDLLAFPDEE